jgi:hypothetical protein
MKRILINTAILIGCIVGLLAAVALGIRTA